ncbi:MAG: methionine--tRNA ligase [Actinomycetota bacterium]
MPRYLVTSALPYVNGVKHLGNLVGSMLPADVYARYLRATGHETLLICATDEHGTPAEIAALEAGLPVREFCQRQWAVQKELGERFQLSFDHFGRSSSPQNHRLSQDFARRLEENGLIEERDTRQVYSLADGRFLPDRYVVGTCPNCGYTAARGDQCENCTRLLDPTELIEPRSAISGSTDLEVRETRHLFLRQSELADEIRAWIDSKKDWPVITTSIAYKWLDEGLHDRCITRDLSWGVPVPKPGYEGKVFYVWFDAPNEYIGSTWEWADLDPGKRDWRSWWYGDAAADVHYVQFMAKDNIPFHTIGWPCTLIGSRDPWKMADYIKGFNWLSYYGGKFSTSRKRGVFMDDALELLPADYWRWYLVANAPETSDADFSWEHFATIVNKDLADTLGNFVNRSLKLTESRLGPTVPAGGAPGEPEADLAREIGERVAAYGENLASMSFRKAAHELREIWAAGNAYLNRQEPWKAVASDPERAALTLRTAINLIRLYALLSSPVIPQTAAAMAAAVHLPADGPAWVERPIAEELESLAPGHPFDIPEVLFRKVAPEDVEAWRARFGGGDEAALTGA